MQTPHTDTVNAEEIGHSHTSSIHNSHEPLSAIPAVGVAAATAGVPALLGDAGRTAAVRIVSSTSAGATARIVSPARVHALLHDGGLDAAASGANRVIACRTALRKTVVSARCRSDLLPHQGKEQHDTHGYSDSPLGSGRSGSHGILDFLDGETKLQKN